MEAGGVSAAAAADLPHGPPPTSADFVMSHGADGNILKRKTSTRSGIDESDTLEIIPLGSGQEVGRSCLICKFKEKTVMFDCGIHPGKSYEGSLPYFDECDIESVDVCLITHFHIDHVGAQCVPIAIVVLRPRVKEAVAPAGSKVLSRQDDGIDATGHTSVQIRARTRSVRMATGRNTLRFECHGGDHSADSPRRENGAAHLDGGID